MRVGFEGSCFDYATDVAKNLAVITYMPYVLLGSQLILEARQFR